MKRNYNTAKRVLFHDLNVARHICDHLIGEKHSERHRMIVGSLIMLIGVLFAKAGAGIQYIHVLSDMGGYFIHAVGSIPFIEKLSRSTSGKAEA